jgi:hypothetical protein
MDGTGDSGGVAPRVDGAAKAALLAVMRAGGCVETGARALGLTLRAFYFARERDAEFDAQWREAHEASAVAERRRRPLSGEGGEIRIAPNNKRVLQKRRIRNVRFTEKKRQIFLAHFAETCDGAAAAAEAGVCERTVLNHRRTDPAFAHEHDAALDQGYVKLEAEALRQRLEEQRRLRSALEACEGGAASGERATLSADAAAEFERMLKLLARRDRKARRPRRTSGGPHKVWTFDAAIELLDKRLEALGIQVPALPPEVAARLDGEGEAE